MEVFAYETLVFGYIPNYCRVVRFNTDEYKAELMSWVAGLEAKIIVERFSLSDIELCIIFYI